MIVGSGGHVSPWLWGIVILGTGAMALYYHAAASFAASFKVAEASASKEKKEQA
jgi:hypothetical protein